MTTLETAAPNVQLVPIDLIDLMTFNSRMAKMGPALEKERKAFEELKASIAGPRGQLQPGLVEGPTEAGRYILVIGSRRYNACRELEREEFLATVRPETDEATRMEDNAIENLKRSNLTSFETARACLLLREKGVTSAKVTEIIGDISASNVRNLSVMYANLAEPIKLDWEQDHPAVSVNFMRSLCVKKDFPTDDDQVKAWEERKAALAKLEESGRKRQPNKAKEEKEDDGDEDEDEKEPAHEVPMARCPVCTKQAPKSIVSQYLVKLTPAAMKRAKEMQKNMRAKPAKKTAKKTTKKTKK